MEIERETPEELTHISDWFWDIVHKAEQNRLKLENMLMLMDKPEVYRFQKEFVEASIELQDEPFTAFIEKCNKKN